MTQSISTLKSSIYSPKHFDFEIVDVEPKTNPASAPPTKQRQSPVVQHRIRLISLFASKHGSHPYRGDSFSDSSYARRPRLRSPGSSLERREALSSAVRSASAQFNFRRGAVLRLSVRPVFAAKDGATPRVAAFNISFRELWTRKALKCICWLAVDGTASLQCFCPPPRPSSSRNPEKLRRTPPTTIMVRPGSASQAHPAPVDLVPTSPLTRRTAASETH